MKFIKIDGGKRFINVETIKEFYIDRSGYKEFGCVDVMAITETSLNTYLFDKKPHRFPPEKAIAIADFCDHDEYCKELSAYDGAKKYLDNLLKEIGVVVEA